MRTSWDVTGAEAGDSHLTAQFNAAGQLTSSKTTGSNAGSASYSFDGAGNRSSQIVNGISTSFGHDAAGRLLSTQTEGRSTSYAYDGLDRRTSVTDETRFGSDTTGTTWDGLDPVATDSGLHGSTELLRDPTGEVVFQSGAYDDAWVLGDARNATATADAGGRITDLVDHADFGAAGFESTGWASLVGNDGQPGDATLGLDHYYARDYDTATGSWVQPDEWRGLLVRPQSLNRFAYVENSPVAFSDHLGFLPIGGGLKGGVAKAYAKHAVKKGGIAAAISKANGPKLPRHSMGTSGGERPGTLSRGGGGPGGAIVPMSRSNVYTSATHDDDPCASCLPIKSRFSGQSDGALDLWGTLLFFGAIIGIAALAVCVVATVGICAAASAAIATASVKVGAKVGVNAAIREISKRYILSFNNHKWSHIIREGHYWDRLAKTRAEVADLMARARAYGTARPDPRGHVDYHWFYKGEEIVVRVGPGGQIGNGWIVK